MKKIMSFAGVAAMAASLLLVASPASATVSPKTLPTGDKMVNLPCNNDNEPTHVFNEVASDGATTAVGDLLNAQSNLWCFGAAGFDKATKEVLSYNWDDNLLYRFNSTTGAVVSSNALTLSGSPYTDVNAIFVAEDGTVYAVAPYILYRVESDFSLTEVGTLPAGRNGVYSAVAFNPVNHKVYAIQGRNGDLFEINLADASGTLVGNIPCTNANDCWSMAFDSTGTIWLEVDADVSDIYTTTLDDLSGNFVRQGTTIETISGTSTPWYGEGMTIVLGDAAPKAKKKTLANTGTNSGAELPFGIALFVAGAAATVFSRRARKN